MIRYCTGSPPTLLAPVQLTVFGKELLSVTRSLPAPWRHRSILLLEPPLLGEPVTYGWSHWTTRKMNSPGNSLGMLNGRVVVLVAPLGSKLSNVSPACEPVPATWKLGVV